MILQHRILAISVLLPLLAASADAAVIYEHSFSGSSAIRLHGLSPDVGPNTWIARRTWMADGTTGIYSSATLPFSPQPGKVYLLSARLTNVIGNNDWLALGYAAGSSTGYNTNSDRFVEGATAGQPWIIRRGNSSSQADQAFAGPGTAGGADISTIDRSRDVDFAIRLDTRPNNWTAEWLQKAADQSLWQSVRTHTYASNPNIAAVGLARANTGTSGKVAYLRLEEVEPDLYFLADGQPRDTAAMLNHPAQFETAFAAVATPSVSWYRLTAQGTVLLEESPGKIATATVFDSAENVYRSALTILDVNTADEGLYFCDIQLPGGYSVQSDTALLTVKRLIAHWTLNAEDYLQDVHTDTIGGFALVPGGAPVYLTGAAGTAQSAIRVGPSPAGTSEPLSAVFAAGFTLSVWSRLDTAAGLFLITGQSTVLDGPTLDADRWQHLCFVFDGQTARLFTDGSFSAEQSWPLSATYEMTLELGHARGGTPFEGGLDDVRLYNAALTDDEVYELYARRTGDAGCVLDYAWWFDLSGPDGWPDCRVDLHDFAVIAAQWLQSADPAVQLPGLVAFADEWLGCGLEPDCL